MHDIEKIADDLNLKINTAEKLLRDTRLCMEADVRVTSNIDLAFRKLDGQWQLVLVYLSTGATERLTTAPLVNRIEAVRYLDALYANMVKAREALTVNAQTAVEMTAAFITRMMERK